MDRTFETHIIATSTCGNYGNPGDFYEVMEFSIARFDDGLFEGRLRYEKGRNHESHEVLTEKEFRYRGKLADRVCSELYVCGSRLATIHSSNDIRFASLDCQYKAEDHVDAMEADKEKPATRVWIAATIVDGSPEVTAHKSEADGWQNIWDEFCVDFWEREVGTPVPTNVGGGVAKLVVEYFSAASSNGKSEECFVVAVDLPL